MFDGLTLEGAPLPPNATFWLGTDMLGRDLLSRLLFGARTSLVIGLVANGVAVLIGMLVGVIAGYFRGWVGNALMRFTDLMMAFPALLLAIVLAALFQPSLWIVALVIALVNWVQVARVIYTETRGAGGARLHRRRALARRRARRASSFATSCRICCRRMIVWGTLGIATTVLLEATLSFLGIGVQPPTAVLGQHHLREPDLFPGRALAGVHSRRGHPGDGAVLQPGRRRAARHPRPDAAGARLMAAYLGRRLVQAVLILLGVALITFCCCSICCRPTRCARSPAAAPRRRWSRTSAISSASTCRSPCSSGAISASLAAAAISAAPTSSAPRSRR